MKVKIEIATTCFACGMQTPYEVKEFRVMTPQEFVNIKLAYLSELNKCSTISIDCWHKIQGKWMLVIYGTPLIMGKRQGCTSVWFTVEL